MLVNKDDLQFLALNRIYGTTPVTYTPELATMLLKRLGETSLYNGVDYVKAIRQRVPASLQECYKLFGTIVTIEFYDILTLCLWQIIVFEFGFFFYLFSIVLFYIGVYSFKN